MATYRWDKAAGRFVDKRTGAFMVTHHEGVCAPMVMRDIPEYRSPIDGRMITSRSARREDLRRNGCVEVDPPKKPRGLKNREWAAKKGLSHMINEEIAGKRLAPVIKPEDITLD